MKRDRYEFRPYSPRRRDIRDWSGWRPVFWAILIIVLVVLVKACCV